MFDARLKDFRRRMAAAGIDVALVTDDDNVYYLTGYYDYLHMDFGRPSILVVPKDGASLLITPSMEAEMASARAHVDRILLWNDGAGDEWRGELRKCVDWGSRLAIEAVAMPPPVRDFVVASSGSSALLDVAPILSDMRMIKSEEELQLARHAGEVAMAMMQAAQATIGDGVPEFEVALATSQAGTRMAARLLSEHYDNRAMSPNTHFLQIMASGNEITKPHHRASTRIMTRGEPVFMCFCGMTNFHRFKLGFDRTFWIGEVPDTRHGELYELALASQAAALAELRPGVTAESVHAAYAAVIQDAGFDYPFRCGRATGYSFLEAPQLVTGDTTVLQPGMVFAVDGSVTQPGEFRAQVGDSVIITENGYEQITHHPKALDDVVLQAAA